MKKFKIYACLLMCFVMLIGICGCSFGGEEEETTHAHRTTTEAKSDPVKSLAVIEKINTSKKLVYFKTVENGVDQKYTYTVGTEFYSKSGTALAASQISAGDLVDIYYEPSTLVVSKIQKTTNSDAWENTNVTSFVVDDNKMSMKIGQTLYGYDESLLVFSNDEEIDVRELNNSTDKLIVRGYKTQVVSVVVDKGHGYVSLTGDTLFIGGIISIGGVVARNIEANMLIPVTEGTYTVEVVNGDYRANKEVTVVRDEEAIVDFSDVPAIVTETGNVKFRIDVKNAKLYIDGEAYDYSSILTLKTGKHTITISATGYDDYTASIEVKAGYQEYEVSMEDVEETTTESTTTSSESETTVEGETYVSTINDVTVSGPEGGTVYFDGNYVGVAPVTFDMVTGSHVISILYNMEIKSYTVNLVEGADDVTYDFSDK